MHSCNEQKRLVQSTQVDPEKPFELAEKIASATAKGATSHIIGKLPVKGQVLEINGLKYKVEFADYVRGQFQVKMVQK